MRTVTRVGRARRKARVGYRRHTKVRAVIALGVHRPREFHRVRNPLHFEIYGPVPVSAAS